MIALSFLLAALPRFNSLSLRTQRISGGSMTTRKLNKLALMCAASVVALTTGAHAQVAQNTESVTVTGSRIISDISLSPTPITAVSAEQLQATTPSDIPDALNKLPVFIGGRGPRSQ